MVYFVKFLFLFVKYIFIYRTKLNFFHKQKKKNINYLFHPVFADLVSINFDFIFLCFNFDFSFLIVSKK